MHISLLLLLLVCHMLGDYTQLSRPYMLAAKKLGKPWEPIAEHAFVHALLMALILIPYMYFAVGLLGGKEQRMVVGVCTIELISHFFIDLLKGRINGWFPSVQNPANYSHWWLFGLDQLAHIFVIIGIWYIVVTQISSL